MNVRDVLRDFRRVLRLSPMQSVLRELRRRGVKAESLRVLELFGGTGNFHTRDYAPHVASLEVWEMDPALEAPLRRNLPRATVRITDTYQRIKTVDAKYDMIVVDNPMSLHGPHCEHFDLFPDIFRICADRAVIILDVIPSVTSRTRRRYPYLFGQEQLCRRAEFYGTDNPADISLADMISEYRRRASTADFAVDWHFFRRRRNLQYLVMHTLR